MSLLCVTHPDCRLCCRFRRAMLCRAGQHYSHFRISLYLHVSSILIYTVVTDIPVSPSHYYCV
jgi:hypothetical protein